METNVYMDLHIPNGRRSGRRARSYEGLSPSQTVAYRAAHAKKILHGAYCKLADKAQFIEDLPKESEKGNPLSMIRVFSESGDEMLDLIEAVKEPLADIGVLEQDEQPVIKRVPANFEGPWAVMTRYRIPSRNSFSKCDFSHSYRQAAMRKADELRLPFYFLQSESNGQAFLLHCLREVFPERPLTPEGATPSSYGLSRKDCPIPVPVLGV